MSASLSPRFPAAGARPTRQRLDDLEALLQRMLDLPAGQAEAKGGSVPEEPAPVDPPALKLLRPPVSSYAAPLEASNPPSQAASPPAAAASEITATPGVRGPEAVANQVTPPVAAATVSLAAAQPVPATSSAPAEAAASASPKAERLAESGAKEEWVPFSSNWRPSSQTWAPLRETWQKARAPESSPKAPAPRPPNAAAPKESTTTAPSALPAALSTGVQLDPDNHELELDKPAVHAPDLPPLPMWILPLAWVNIGFDWLTQHLGAPGRWLRARNGKDMLGVVGILALAAAAGLMVADWYGWTW